MANEVLKTYLFTFLPMVVIDPQGGLGYIADLENHLSVTTGRIATIIGRYYSMDRDKKDGKELQKPIKSWSMAKESKPKTASQAIRESYESGITDEFIEPIVITDSHDLSLSKNR